MKLRQPTDFLIPEDLDDKGRNVAIEGEFSREVTDGFLSVEF
jgi:hypothetical protein